jgi:hypothetical protein
MPAADSAAASGFRENQGQKRECGVLRTSAIALTPALRSSARKRSAGMFE